MKPEIKKKRVMKIIKKSILIVVNRYQETKHNKK